MPAILLSQATEDFTDGEFLLTEKRPRRPSRAEVLPRNQGAGVIFAFHCRPVQSVRGSYQVNLRHGVSRVLSGRRFTLDIVFTTQPSCLLQAIVCSRSVFDRARLTAASATGLSSGAQVPTHEGEVPRRRGVSGCRSAWFPPQGLSCPAALFLFLRQTSPNDFTC